MATNYSPGQGRIRVVGGCHDIKKFPISAYPRQFPAGTPMWLNKVAAHYQAEPSLLTTQQATVDVLASTASGDSGYATLALANDVFGPLFLGFAAEGRVFQQLGLIGQASVPRPWTNYAQDASRPFISIYDRGIAIAPLTKTENTSTPLTTALEIGDLVALDGFSNTDAAASGFYDPAGRACVTAGNGYWLHMNRVILTTDGTQAIGIVIERAPIGATFVKFQFETTLSSYLLTVGK